MSLLAPALFGVLLPLLVLPVAIHILNKGFPRRFQFPSIEIIKETMARRSKLHRWRHWILLLLRTVVLALLLLAFLRPVLRRNGGNPSAGERRSVLIVFDHSMSMEDRGDGPTSRERALSEAAKLIDSLNVSDQVNVLLMEPALSTSFVNFSTDQSAAKEFLNHLKPGLGRADVNRANASIPALFPKEAARPEIYYISDFERKKWANADFSKLPPAAKLFFVDVGPAHRDNRAILDARPAESQILSGDTVTLDVTVGNFSEQPFNGRLTAEVDKRFTFDQEVSIAPWSEGKVTVPVTPGGPGVHLCEVRLPADALEYDNHFFLTLPVREKEEVLVVSDGPKNAKGSSYFLKTALNPFGEQAGALLPRVIGSGELNSGQLAGVEKLFLTQVNHLSAEECHAIAGFMFQGGGVVYFLDGPADAENLAALEKETGPNTIPLRLAGRNVATNLVSGAQQFARGDFHSPYLKMFSGTTRQDLGLLEFYDYFRAGATGAGDILLTYGDESPAMASLHHGLGTLLLMNFSVSEFSSNLARQRIFPAWMQELVKALAIHEQPPVAYTVGEPLQTEMWRNEGKNDLFSPAGAVSLVRRDLQGERCVLSFTPDQVGFYTLGAPRPLYAFGINPASDQGDLRPIDKDVLPKEFASNHDAHYLAGGEDYEELARGRTIYHWFVYGALGFLIMESGFQFWLKRRGA